MATATSPAPMDTITLNHQPVFDNGTFTVTGTATSSVGVKSVELDAFTNNGDITLGPVTPDANGNFSISFPLASGTYDDIYAVETDNSGYRFHNLNGTISVTGKIQNTNFAAQETIASPIGQNVNTLYFSEDGSLKKERLYNSSGALKDEIDYHPDGSSVFHVDSSNQTVESNYFDTFLAGNTASNTFVFDPGHGLDIIHGFEATGGTHDTISLPNADFTSIADVLRHTQSFTGGTAIHDPVSGDTVRLPGVSKSDLIANQQDFKLHS